MPRKKSALRRPLKANSKTLLKHANEEQAPSDSPIPEGYVFVSNGDKYMTRHCRKLAYESNATLYIVYDPQAQPRVKIGLRCPATIHADVTRLAESTAEAREAVVRDKDKLDLNIARGGLLRAFERIPRDIAERVLKHGLEKGSKRVGRTGKLSGIEKVERAVIAYARHNFTGYDALLRKFRRDGMEMGTAKARARKRSDII